MNMQDLMKKELEYFKDGNQPTEFDTEINDISRAKINLMKGRGEVWLGNINRYRKEDKPYLVQYAGETIYNFEYSFAIPCFDQELIDLIIKREKTPYKGVEKDAQLIIVIMDRIKELRGIHLFWV